MDSRAAQAATILAGAPLLIWPALYNAYPILFSDTGGLLDMGLLPSIGWDKPFVYGPIIAALSLRLTLWLPVLAQGGLLSHALWTLQSGLATPTPIRHLALCAALAATTAAPWFAATLMPDALTPIAAISLIAAASPLARHRPTSTIIAAIAIAAHLSHLILAAALIAALILLNRRIPWRPIASLAAALLFLFASNWIGHGRPSISPYGSVFALARLIADGPARTYLAHACPAAGYILCPWRDRLTDDSDQFLWDPNSPFWADPTPLPQFAAEAAQIVRATILHDPAAALRHAYRNTVTELTRTDLGDTIVPDYLADAVRPRIIHWFPEAERQRFDQSRQLQGTLAPSAARLRPLDRAVLALSALACTLILLRGLRTRTSRADLAALLLIALAANAFSTGALSAIHDRYQARLAWLIVLPLLLRFPRAQTDNADTSAGAIRTSAS